MVATESFVLSHQHGARREGKKMTFCFNKRRMGACMSREHEILRLRLAMRALQDQPLQERFQCKICFDEILSCVFLPCGHCVACAKCARCVRRCPICAEVITHRTWIHYS